MRKLHLKVLSYLSGTEEMIDIINGWSLALTLIVSVSSKWGDLYV